MLFMFICLAITCCLTSACDSTCIYCRLGNSCVAKVSCLKL